MREFLRTVDFLMQLDCVGGYLVVGFVRTHRTIDCKGVNFIVYKLCLNKSNFKTKKPLATQIRIKNTAKIIMKIKEGFNF